MAARLSAAIQLKTVSHDPPASAGLRRAPVCASFHNHSHFAPPAVDAGAAAGVEGEVPPGHHETASALRAFHDLLEKEYPRMHERLQRIVVNGLSLVFVWRGSDPHLQASGLYAHMDVVPAPDAAEWTHAPFSGRIADGYVWGRGAIDDKQAVIGLCEAVEHLVVAGFQPRRNVVIMLGHDEEIGGNEGAALCAHWVADNVRVTSRDTGEAVKPLAFLLDEGLFVLQGVVPGMQHRTALICTAEKGYVDVELSVHLPGGHASIPPAETAVGVISKAVARLEASPFPTRLSGASPVMRMFSTLLPYLSFPFRLLFANQWLLLPVIRAALASKPNSAALIRTTTAPTVFHAGDKNNTLPPSARAVVNHRILPPETVASVLARDAAVIADPRVRLSVIAGLQREPSPVSDDAAPAFQLLAAAVERLFVGTVAAPSLMVGATDSPWSAGIAEQIYRHCPTELRSHEVAMFHGINERIAVANLARIAAFYARVILSADAHVRM